MRSALELIPFATDAPPQDGAHPKWSLARNQLLHLAPESLTTVFGCIAQVNDDVRDTVKNCLVGGPHVEMSVRNRARPFERQVALVAEIQFEQATVVDTL